MTSAYSCTLSGESESDSGKEDSRELHDDKVRYIKRGFKSEGESEEGLKMKGGRTALPIQGSLPYAFIPPAMRLSPYPDALFIDIPVMVGDAVCERPVGLSRASFRPVVDRYSIPGGAATKFLPSRVDVRGHDTEGTVSYGVLFCPTRKRTPLEVKQSCGETRANVACVSKDR